MTSADRSSVNRSVLTYHRIAEAFKFGYAYRALLGDEDYANVTEVTRWCMSRGRGVGRGGGGVGVEAVIECGYAETSQQRIGPVVTATIG